MDLRILEEYTRAPDIMSIRTIVADALSGQRLTPHQISTIDTLLKHRRYSTPELRDLDTLIDAIASGSLPATPEILYSVLRSS